MKPAAWRSVECPRCLAEPGQRCRRRTFDGWVASTNPHAQRIDIGKAARGDKRKADVRAYRAKHPQYFVRMVI
jgi:hypothetical protein